MIRHIPRLTKGTRAKMHRRHRRRQATHAVTARHRMGFLFLGLR
jgi:hypothetical protein